MERLTTDNPQDNFHTMLNFVYGDGGWAHIRHDGENEGILLTEWAKKECIRHGCDEFAVETYEEIDQEICDCLMMDFPDCPVALAYCFAVQACHLRTRLKMYEDILFDEDGPERVTLSQLQKLADPNDPLTLEDLNGIDGQPVVFPCKIGDLVYEVDKPEYGVITCRVLYIGSYTGPAGHVPGNPMVSTVSIGVEVISGHGKGSSYCFEQEDIGKLVFLTYQAAEDAILAYRRKPDDAQ